MNFYFDESGDFTIPTKAKDHYAAVVMGITVSDLVKKELFERFRKFVTHLDNTELVNKEPKGFLISHEHRKLFCDLLAQFDGISLTPVTLDLSSLVGGDYDQLNKKMFKTLCTHAKNMIYPTAREELLLLAKQFRNLSLSQSLRIYSLANCFKEALEHAIIFLSNRDHENCWENLRFEIDRVQVRSNNREEKVFSFMILAWLSGWSRSNPYTLVKEIHTLNHPFVKKYDTTDGIDLGKLLRGNIFWKDSCESCGIQIADIASNIVYQAVRDLNNSCGSVSLYASLMRKSYYGHVRGPGMFSPLSEIPEATRKKYRILSEAMQMN